MPKQKPRATGLLVKVLKDLDDFLPHLVLIGGWVPYLYNRYLWENANPDPLMTMDIDFGVRRMAFTGHETIAQRVLEKKYKEHHLELGKEIPFVPIVHSKQEGIQADVEFICDLDMPEDVKRKLVGREILVNRLSHTNVLLVKTIRINMEGVSVNVPDPAHYVFHKLLTFAERTLSNKQGKDLAYSYYVLRSSPDRAGLMKAIRRLIQEYPSRKHVVETIKAIFIDPFSKGPSLIFEETKHSSLGTLGIDIRQDSFEKFTSLVS